MKTISQMARKYLRITWEGFDSQLWNVCREECESLGRRFSSWMWIRSGILEDQIAHYFRSRLWINCISLLHQFTNPSDLAQEPGTTHSSSLLQTIHNQKAISCQSISSLKFASIAAEMTSIFKSIHVYFKTTCESLGNRLCGQFHIINIIIWRFFYTLYAEWIWSDWGTMGLGIEDYLPISYELLQKSIASQ